MDVTHVRTLEGWHYVATIMDLYSRKVVGLAQDKHQKTDLALRVLAKSIATRKSGSGLILHTCRGCQFTSYAYHEVLEKHKIVPGVSSTGNCYDNAVAESFFHTMKLGVVRQQAYYSRPQAARCIFEYVEVFCNQPALHSSLEHLIPCELEMKLRVYEQFIPCTFV